MAIKISGTTVINDTTSYVNLGTTGGVRVPLGTTAQRQNVLGIWRWNTSTSALELYMPDGSWQLVSLVSY